MFKTDARQRQPSRKMDVRESEYMLSRQAFARPFAHGPEARDMNNQM